MKKYFGFLLVIVFAIGVYFIVKNNGQKNENVINFIGSDLNSAIQITCKYPQIIMASYQDNQITHELPPPETNPMIFSFSKLNDPEMAELSFIDSTQSISTVPIYKLYEDKEKYVFIEGGGEVYTTIHTIYKNFGVSTYTKSINFLGVIPSTTSGMGTCMPY